VTITIAWERRLPAYSEIVFCSDSRLGGGGNIDVCQKIFPLPREDAAIGFCGSTLIAYPLINQFISYIKHYKKNIDRALDGSELPRRFCELANHFLKSYMNAADLQGELKETAFIIGFFSYRLKRPQINRIRYDNGAKRFVSIDGRFPKGRNKTLHNSGRFAMIGDLKHNYYDALQSLMPAGKTTFDMEPFSALCEMLGDIRYVDRFQEARGPIGGAPQLLKIYPFLRTVEFAIRWPNHLNGKLYLNGRETFEYEKIHVPHINADDLNIFYPLVEIPGRNPYEARLVSSPEPLDEIPW